jgi:hypothetical protein
LLRIKLGTDRNSQRTKKQTQVEKVFHSDRKSKFRYTALVQEFIW